MSGIVRDVLRHNTIFDVHLSEPFNFLRVEGQFLNALKQVQHLGPQWLGGARQLYHSHRRGDCPEQARADLPEEFDRGLAPHGIVR